MFLDSLKLMNEYISFLRSYMCFLTNPLVNIFAGYVVTQSLLQYVLVDLYVLCLVILDWVMSNVNDRFIITQKLHRICIF